MGRLGLLLLAAAFIARWLAHTELGAEVRADPMRHLGTATRIVARIVQGQRPPVPTRPVVMEDIAEFGADEPIRKLAAAIGMLTIYKRTHDGERRVFLCTAAVIAADKLITNAHCVPGNDAALIVDRVELSLHFASDRQPVVFPVATTPIEMEQRKRLTNDLGVRRSFPLDGRREWQRR